MQRSSGTRDVPSTGLPKGASVLGTALDPKDPKRLLTGSAGATAQQIESVRRLGKQLTLVAASDLEASMLPTKEKSLAIVLEAAIVVAAWIDDRGLWEPGWVGAPHATQAKLALPELPLARDVPKKRTNSDIVRPALPLPSLKPVCMPIVLAHQSVLPVV